jgi:hypothetical protein
MKNLTVVLYDDGDGVIFGESWNNLQKTTNKLKGIVSGFN